MTGPLIPQIHARQQRDEVSRMHAHDAATARFFAEKHAARIVKRQQRAIRRLRKRHAQALS